MLPSIMHRVENMLVAIELKDMLSKSFAEGTLITAERVRHSYGNSFVLFYNFVLTDCVFQLHEAILCGIQI